MSFQWYCTLLTRYRLCALCLIASLLFSLLAFRSLQYPLSNYVEHFVMSDSRDSFHKMVTTAPTPESRLRVVSPGTNLQTGGAEIFLPTAVHYPDFPARGGFNLFLNGWARHNGDMSFKCCLLRSLPTGELDDETFTEVQAYSYFEYDQWLVDMQAAEFSCSISGKQIASIGDANFTHVAFAETSCLRAPRDVMKIVYPPRAGGTVGVCLKISYGSLDPEKMVEWFEYQRMMNVTKVFTYTHGLDRPSLSVLEFYQKIGFLDMQPIDPAKSKFGPRRGYRRPRFEEQAWVDEVMAANDCKHRMSGYDYVIVMDMDEFIVPLHAMRSYHDILEEVSRIKPSSAAFGFDSHVVMLDWGVTRRSPLHIMRYVTRTTKANYDGVDRNSRWAFKPRRTYYAKNNYVVVQANYTDIFVPHNLYILLHYRHCKHTWQGCKDRERTSDDVIVKHERALIQGVLKLPLEEILYNNTRYVRQLRSWKIS